MSDLPFARALHPDDYTALEPHVRRLNTFEKRLSSQGVFYRKDHAHRSWEYACLLDLLERIGVPKDARILDTGSGASYLPPYLVAEAGYANVTVSDSMAYGSIEQKLIEQSYALDIRLPMAVASVERLTDVFAPHSFDVTMCISVIEHVDATLFRQAMRQLVEVTVPGGLIFLTSDYFESEARADQSPFRSIQHTIFTPETIESLIASCDLDAFLPEKRDWTYRGDWVNNYSFVTFSLRTLALADIRAEAAALAAEG